MDEPIIVTIKKMIGIAEDYDAFDADIGVMIRSAFSTLHQLGFESYQIDSNTTWNDLDLPEECIGMVQDYIYLQVKKEFDPPSTSFVLESISSKIKELEWRLNVFVDNPDPEEEPEED